jgi:hypothetical protein
MKIGIITIHRSPNYGACLQSYGLYTFLKNKGYDVEIIDLLRPTHTEYNQSKKYVPYRREQLSIIQKIIKSLLGISPKKRLLTNEAQLKFESFNNQIRYSRTYYSIDELYKNPPEYDIYITGSDQLWNPTMKFCIEPYFLTFVKNGGRKISYATSIGIEKLENNEKEDFSKWLSEYYSISVREKSGKGLLSELVTSSVTQVADPSFLLEPSQWKNIIVPSKIEESYILLFTLNYNRELIEFCNRLRKESGKRLVYLCLYQPIDVSNLVDIVIDDAGPQEFLGYINSADMVITNSFHGTVFSLILDAGNIFSYVPSSQKRGKRITDLLDTYNLSDHVLHDDLSISYKELEGRSIDKNFVSEKMNNERRRSQEYLLKQLL